jgi:hypothetical protein
MTKLSSRLASALFTFSALTLVASGCNATDLDGVGYGHYTADADDGESGDAEGSTDEGADHGGDDGYEFGNEHGAAAECGNGELEGFEECDDGMDNGDTQACTSECRINVCGDGLLFANVEECDDGEMNGVRVDGAIPSCEADCTWPVPE